MQDVVDICCGLDVHKESVAACRIIRTFSTLLSGLAELKAWLEAENCRYVVWKVPVFTGNPFTSSGKVKNNLLHLSYPIHRIKQERRKNNKQMFSVVLSTPKKTAL